MKSGKPILEWMQEYQVEECGIDIRRFTSFGVIKVVTKAWCDSQSHSVFTRVSSVGSIGGPFSYRMLNHHPFRQSAGLQVL